MWEPRRKRKLKQDAVPTIFGFFMKKQATHTKDLEDNNDTVNKITTGTQNKDTNGEISNDVRNKDVIENVNNDIVSKITTDTENEDVNGKVSNDVKNEDVITENVNVS